MANFRTQYDKPTRFHVEPGVRVKTLYGPIFDDNGVMHLVETGKHNLYAEIQSHAESVDIHVIMARYQNGDVEALSRVQGTYGDFTEMPTTFAGALNAMIAAEQYFLSLPPEVRAKYNQDFNQFLASMDRPGFASDIGLVPPAATPGTDPTLPTNPGQTGSSGSVEASVQSAGPQQPSIPPAPASSSSS